MLQYVSSIGQGWISHPVLGLHRWLSHSRRCVYATPPNSSWQRREHIMRAVFMRLYYESGAKVFFDGDIRVPIYGR